MKTINVKAYNTKKITKELPVVTNDGQPTIIKAEKGINYEFFDQSIGRAPNHIITKRSGKDLHLSFERDGKETDLIIEGFYDNEDHALIGIAEDGQYYYYIPDTGEVSEYVTQLVEGKVEGQALGGEHLVAPWWVALPHGAGMPWWLGLGVLPVLFSGDDDSSTNTPEPTPSTTISTSPNSKTGEPHQSVTQNVISNDKSVTHLNLSSLVIIDPKTGKPSTENNGDTLTIANQGVWSVVKDANGNKTGEIKFTPNADFIQNPTPINYQVKDNAGNLSVPTPVAVIYNQPLSPDIKTGKTGTTVTQNVLLNDSANTTKDSLKLVDKHGNGVDSLHVDGQGVWTVIKADGKPTGEISFQPDAGFVSNPTPVQYQVIDNAGNAISTSVAVIYDNNPNITNPDVKAGKPGQPGQPVTINATNNDGTVKPETIKLIDPNNPGSVDKPNLVDSVNTFTDDGKPEGTWQIVKDSTGKPTGEVLFTPAPTFLGEPKPINYVITGENGQVLPPTPIIVSYPPVPVAPATPPVAKDDTQTATAVGIATTVAVVGNDTDPNNNIDPTSVQIVGSTDGKTLVVNGEGTWTVDPATGSITFKPEASFKGDPTPISYTVKDSTGLVSNPATVTIDYPAATAPVAKDDTQTATAVGVATTVAVVGNDADPENNIDPTTVVITQAPAGSTIAADGKSVVVAGQGTWTVDPVTGNITFKPDTSFKGDPTPISYTVKDSTGLVSNPATVTIDYPAVVLTSKLAVSEEALTYGIKDSIGNPTDTTDSAAATGSFGTATSAITTISAPTTAVYSGGEKVIWTSANGVLTGKTETTGVDVIKVTSGAFAASTGAGYTVTLLKAIDHPTGQNENTLDITFGVQTSTEMGQITLTVEDDAPVTTNATLSAASSTISSFYANVNLIMDLSGSTSFNSSIPGKTVFESMKDSVNKLLDYYQGMLNKAGGNGDVRVDISVFADFAKHLSLDGSTPSYWVSLAEAKKLLDTIQSPSKVTNNGVGLETNYDAALQEMIKGYQQSNVGPLQNKPGLTNSAYFFTDGEPNFYTDPTGSNPNNTGWDSKYTPGHSGINPGSFSGYVAGGNTEIGEKDWTDFLTANKIKAYAIGLDVIGLGRSVDIANITPISYDGTTATNADAILAKRITDYSQLDTFLASTVTTSSSAPAPLTATGLIKSGADANYTASMTVDNITYTYQTSTGKITSDYAHTAWKDLGNGDLQVTTHSGGTVSLHLGQGANLGNMTYQAPSSILNGHTSETIGYTITDGDGDKASGTATIDLSALPKLVEHALQASTSTTVSGTANVADVFTLSGLTNNGSDTITNFEVGTDKLGFSGIKEISDLKNISAQASGGNTIVHFTTADTIASHLTLTGVTLDTTTIQNWLVNNSVIM